jgi:hypothetical protein
MNETYSIQVKRGEPNFGSSSIQIDGIPFGTSDKELDKLVKEALNGMHQARQTLLNYEPPKEKPAQVPCPFKTRVSNIVSEKGFTKEQCREFKAICDNRGLEHIHTFLCAWEDGCESYDEFVCYAASDTKPQNAKPRLEVAQ